MFTSKQPIERYCLFSNSTVQYYSTLQQRGPHTVQFLLFGSSLLVGIVSLDCSPSFSESNSVLTMSLRGTKKRGFDGVGNSIFRVSSSVDDCIKCSPAARLLIMFFAECSSKHPFSSTNLALVKPTRCSMPKYIPFPSSKFSKVGRMTCGTLTYRKSPFKTSSISHS